MNEEFEYQEFEHEDGDETFFIPDKMIHKLYDISGGVEKNKGIIMVACNEKGDPVIYSKFEDAVTELGMRSALTNWLSTAKN